jgi:hypothetical protein
MESDWREKQTTTRVFLMTAVKKDGILLLEGGRERERKKKSCFVAFMAGLL